MQQEIEKIFISQPDEKTLEHLSKIREENSEIQNVLNWVEEFSNLNQYQKEILTSLKNKNLIAEATPKAIQSSIVLDDSTSLSNSNSIEMKEKKMKDKAYNTLEHDRIISSFKVV